MSSDTEEDVGAWTSSDFAEKLRKMFEDKRAEDPDFGYGEMFEVWLESGCGHSKHLELREGTHYNLDFGPWEGKDCMFLCIWLVVRPYLSKDKAKVRPASELNIIRIKAGRNVLIEELTL